VLCPACRLPSLPPAVLQDGDPRSNPAVDPALKSLLVKMSERMTPEPAPRSPLRLGWAAPLRSLLAVGLAFSLFMSLVSFLDSRPSADWIFRAVASVCLILLLRKPRKNRPQAPAAPETAARD